MAKPKELVHLGVTVPATLKKQLEQLANKNRRKISEEVRIAVEDHLKASASPAAAE